MQAYYRPDKTARAFWLGRLKEKAVVRTSKGIVVAVPRYAIVYRKA